MRARPIAALFERCMACGRERVRLAQGGPETCARLVWADISGAAILEFAIALPILLFVLFGVFEVGRTIYIASAMENALQGGARYLARTADPSCSPACTSGVEHAVRLARDQIVRQTGISDEAVTVSPVSDPPIGTVALKAQVGMSYAFLSSLGVPRLWTLTVVRQEQHLAR